MFLQAKLLQIGNYLSIPRILYTVNAILACSIVWLTGSLGALIIENELLEVPYQETKYIPPASLQTDNPQKFSRFQPIIDMNVFDAEVTAEIIPEVAETEPTGPAPGEILNGILADLQLLGINYRKGYYNYCILKSKKKNSEEIYTIGDEVFETGVVVKRIFTSYDNQRVHLKLGDEIGILKYDMDDKETTNQPSEKKVERRRPSRSQLTKSVTNEYTTDGKEFYIPGSEVDSHLNNFGNLLNQARMIPYFKKGKHQGFKVKAIDKNSLYEKLGLKNNDIIKSVNGETLAEAGGEKLMGLFKLLRNEREFSVEVERGGASHVMNYHIN